MSFVTDFRLAGRFAARELRGGLTGFRILLACLALGVAAISGVGSVRTAIETGLTEEGAALLGGDAEISLTYRFANEAEQQWMRDNAVAVSEIADFRSMATVTRDGVTERALTQVKAVDDLYPLIGAVALEPAMPLDQAFACDPAQPCVVAEALLTDRLGLRPGDSLKLGTKSFTLAAVLTREPDSATAGFGLGPRLILRRADLEGAGLLAPGTLFDSRYRLKLAEDADLAALEAEAKEAFADSGLRWRDARNGTPGLARFVERLGAFLILVGLSGLAVGGIGVSMAARAYIARKTAVIATLRTVGATRRVIFLAYFFQIGVLAVLGIVAGLILGGLVPLALAPVLAEQLPVPARFALYPAPLAEAALYGVLTAAIFTLWPLARADEVRAATLFRDQIAAGRVLPSAGYLVVIALLVGLLVSVAAYFSGTWRLTLWTAGGIGFALILLTLAGIAVRWLARRLTARTRGNGPVRWAISAIGGPGSEALPVVMSLGLGLSVLAAVGQIDGNLRGAIVAELPDRAPSYFFVDLQKDQMPGFLERVEQDPQVSRVDSAPMLRGVITRINGQPAREVAGDHWVLRGDRGLTYSADLPENTRVTEGSWWGPDYSGPPLISFADEEAREMGLSIGDEMTINILGRDITGTIASFREVDFSSAGMGFITAMNPGALSGAPHSFIATVYAEAEAEAQILRDVGNAYPNVTAIGVRDAIERVSVLLAGIASATSWGAGATLLTGFLVLIGAALSGEHARMIEAAILKTLGATRAQILTSLAYRSALLGAAAGSVALAAGIAAGWAICRFVLETDYEVIWGSALIIVGLGLLANLLAGLGFALRPLAARPARILRAKD